MNQKLENFSETFERVILECANEEEYVKNLQKEYEEALKALEANNEKRAKILGIERNKKIKEIDSEITKSNAALEKTIEKEHKLFGGYCEKHGHDLVLTSTRKIKTTRDTSSTYGSIIIATDKYKCAVCEEEISVTHTTHFKEPQKYKRIIPDELTEEYDAILLERNKIEQYIHYLHSLKERICIIFDHDVDFKNEFKDGFFYCKCCGHYMFLEEYTKAHDNAVYKRVVPFCIEDKDFIINDKENKLVRKNGGLHE